MACVACAAACAQLVAWRTRALRLAALVAEKASLVAQATELQRQVRIGGAALSRVLTEREGLAEKTSGLEVALTKAKQLADAAGLEAAALVQERGTLLARVVRLEDDCQKLTSAAEAAEASVEAGGAHPIDPAPRPTPTPTSALVSAPMSTLRGAWARDASATPPGASDSSDAEKKSGIPRPRSRQQSKAAVPEPAAASPTVAKGVLSTVKAPVSPHTCHSLSPRRWPASAAAASPPSPAATPPSAVATPPESRPPAAGHDNSRTGGSVKSGGARRSGASVGSAASSLTARARGLLTAYEGKLRGEGAWLDTVRQQRDALLGLLDGDDEDVPTTAAAPVTPRSALTQQPGDSPTLSATTASPSVSPSVASVTFSTAATAATTLTTPATPATPPVATATATELSPDVALRVVTLDSTLQRRIAEQGDQIKVLLRQRDSLSMTKSSLAAKIDILEGQRQTDKQMFAWLTEERERLIEERTDAERRISEVEVMVAQRGSTAAALAEQSVRVATLEATVVSLNRTMKNVRDEAAMAEERIDELALQLKAANERAAALQAKVDAADSAEIELRAAAAWEEARRAVAEGALEVAKTDYAVALAARDARHAEAQAAVAETGVQFSKLEALLHEADDNDRALRAEIDHMAAQHAAAEAAAAEALREAQAEAARLSLLLNDVSVEEKTA